jgi:phosphotriesterase-related protein
MPRRATVTTETSVETVRGPIPVAALGVTLMHEHVFVLTTDVQQNYPDEWDEEAQIGDAVARLAELRSLGVDTIVDPTVVGLGRYIPRIMRVNEQVDLNIVVATGIYTYSDVPFFFRHRGTRAMTELFVRDLTDSIPGTGGVRAAFLKCAVDEAGLTAGVERVLRAVCAAHHRTGAPIMVHTHPGARTADAVARLVGEEGIDPRRVLLAHCGDAVDLDYLAGLASAGFLLGMDRFGIDTILPTAQRIDTVVELVRWGFAGRMVLSHDAACYLDWMDPVRRTETLPNWHFRHLHEDVLPALRERGVSEVDIETMLVGNPRDFFAGP